MDHEKENKSLTRGVLSLVFCLLVRLAAPTPPAWADAEPVFSASGPDADAYGAAVGYPVGPRAATLPQADLVGQYSHFAEKYPSRIVARSGPVSFWRRADRELSLTYDYRGASHDLPDYLSRQPVTIFIDPAAKLVLVRTAVTPNANGEPARTELRALWAALLGLATASPGPSP
jgi:hypothetical protein